MVVEKHLYFQSSFEDCVYRVMECWSCIQISRMLIIEMNFTEEQFQIVF